MTSAYQLRLLCREIKQAIKYANDHAQYTRVQQLKSKRRQIKAKIRNYEK